MEFLTGPWQWWVQPFIGDPVLQRAVLAGLLTVLVTSVVGTWVVLRGTTYLGEALGHGILPGVAAAYLLGGNPTVGALVAAAAMAVGVRGIQRRSPLPGESAIGLLLVGMLALTVVLVAAADGIDEHDLQEMLFGALLDTSPTDLLLQAVLVGVAILVALVFHRALLVLTFDEVQAR
ncbi:MAG TPA: ABC transporter permease, partial [Acidimicrobiaceae bacterium]|nr:ABC transporter permease [Acidimicrobiaceae bacterium]